MEKTKKTAKVFLVISILLMFVSAIVASAVQTNGGKVRMEELNIMTDEGYTMSAYLFVPENATKDTPAPAIVTSHGYLNNKEMTDANYVELARRGYVVLAIDQPDHGDSEVTEDFFILAPTGVYQGVLALSRMPFVDKGKIGVTGHSMGSWSVNAAVKQDNLNETPLISAVLIHCNDAVYTDDDGNYVNIYGSRDVGIISAVYDEFFGGSVDENGNALQSPYYMESANAQSFLYFGTDPSGKEAREAYTFYTENFDGKEVNRIIYRPGIIHPWSHFSARSEKAVCEFFEKALPAPNPIAPDSQIWQVKEAFNFVGVIGLVMFICSFGTLLVFTPVFESLRAKEIAKPDPIDKTGTAWYFGSMLVCGIFGCIVYLGLVNIGNSAPVAQGESLGLGLWSTACGIFTIISMILAYQFYGKKHGMNLKEKGVFIPVRKLGLSVLLAVIVVVVSYSCVFFADYFFKTDFRLWTLAFKAFEAPILKYWPYMLLFVTYYIAASVASNCFNFNAIGKEWGNAIINGIFAAFPALVLPWIQYIHYYSTKSMMWSQPTMASPNYPMFVLWLFPVVLILFGSTIVSRVFYKTTKNPYIAGIINALLVGIITIINTCTVAV